MKHLSEKLCIMNWLPKSMLSALGYGAQAEQSTKQYDSDKQGLQKKIEKDIDQKMPNTSGLFKKTNYNTKMIQLENKIPSVTGYYCFSQYQRHKD